MGYRKSIILQPHVLTQILSHKLTFTLGPTPTIPPVRMGPID